ncbi:MAG: 30S ribosome-binding factor RbfA [Rhizobiaceae bacterium]
MPAKKQSSGPSQRMLRVGEMVRHAVTEVLQRNEIIDPLLETTVVSVTQVAMSPDLSNATAYIQPLGVADPAPVIDALNRHAKFIRGALGPALRQLRAMPQVRFRLDTSFDNYAKIDALLRSPEVARDLARNSNTSAINARSKSDDDDTSDAESDGDGDGGGGDA